MGYDKRKQLRINVAVNVNWYIKGANATRYFYLKVPTSHTQTFQETLNFCMNNNIVSSFTMSLPKTTESWTVEDKGSFDALKFNKEGIIPEIPDNEVLVKMHAVSLNFRDLIITLVFLSSGVLRDHLLRLSGPISLSAQRKRRSWL